MERTVENIAEMYSEMMILMRNEGMPADSRNGEVLYLTSPLLVNVANPMDRVVLDPVRNANPFFHVMEFVWMMAGRQDPEYLMKFIKDFDRYADRNNHTGRMLLHGAYGHRWREHFNIDQLLIAVKMLQDDPNSRRVVLGMWDPKADLMTNHADLPCNTHIYLSIRAGELDMTVCNRSNDVIWGMTGANAVHMTLLQELLAGALGMHCGWYHVMTNNAHIYLDLPKVEEMISNHDTYRVIRGEKEVHVPVLHNKELSRFLLDCKYFCNERYDHVESEWLNSVAKPVIDLWDTRDLLDANAIVDSNWRLACSLWLQRNTK
jgi:hypothetical protein